MAHLGPFTGFQLTDPTYGLGEPRGGSPAKQKARGKPMNGGGSNYVSNREGASHGARVGGQQAPDGCPLPGAAAWATSAVEPAARGDFGRAGSSRPGAPRLPHAGAARWPRPRGNPASQGNGRALKARSSPSQSPSLPPVLPHPPSVWPSGPSPSVPQAPAGT